MSRNQLIKQPSNMIGRPTFRKSINRSTQLQTVQIRLPGRPHEHYIYSLEHYPICPVEIPKCQPVFIETLNGDTYMWDEADGSASIISADGTYRFFRRKPTIADAVYNVCGYTESCFNFLKDGTVEHRLGARHYWWGPTTIIGKPVRGTMDPPTDDVDIPCDDGCVLCRRYSDDESENEPCDSCQSMNCSGHCGSEHN